MMAFLDNLVASIVSGGVFVRDVGGVVRLPFGSDYAVRLKNKAGQTAVVDVEIDGKTVNEGGKIVIRPNESATLEGFMGLDGKVAHAFRFIQKTAEIAKTRGDREDDGIVSVRFQFETPPPATRTVETVWRERYLPYPYWPYDAWLYHPWSPWIAYCSVQQTGTFGLGGGTKSAACPEPTMGAIRTALNSQPLPDEGITVAGAERNQQFRSVSVGGLDPQVHVINLRLVGIPATEEQKVVSTRAKAKCSTCGGTLKGEMRFCPTCGTAT